MNNETPNPKRHFVASIIKSVIRIVGFTTLLYGSFIACGMLLIIAEVIGIVEELV